MHLGGFSIAIYGENNSLDHFLLLITVSGVQTYIVSLGNASLKPHCKFQPLGAFQLKNRGILQRYYRKTTLFKYYKRVPMSCSQWLNGFEANSWTNNIYITSFSVSDMHSTLFWSSRSSQWEFLKVGWLALEHCTWSHIYYHTMEMWNDTAKWLCMYRFVVDMEKMI